jgi:DNA-binding XRE family transcriptional regulator
MIKLKLFRQDKKLSQEKMAQLIGVSVSFYQKVENGAVKPSREFMKKFKTQFRDADMNHIFFED